MTCMCFPEERKKERKKERRSLLFHLYTTWSDSLKAKTKGFR
ncbi:hypothetical protein [Vibrio gallaecicus]|nr:hypothetical protein [Vibrio gallaecicus]MDN3616320.1 hypothetical protein [Vibrio gallaecicus]